MWMLCSDNSLRLKMNASGAHTLMAFPATLFTMAQRPPSQAIDPELDHATHSSPCFLLDDPKALRVGPCWIPHSGHLSSQRSIRLALPHINQDDSDVLKHWLQRGMGCLGSPDRCVSCSRILVCGRAIWAAVPRGMFGKGNWTQRCLAVYSSSEAAVLSSGYLAEAYNSGDSGKEVRDAARKGLAMALT